MGPMVVRDALVSDVPGVQAIYDEQVRTGISTFDTAPPAADVWVAKLGSSEPGDHFLVAVDVDIVTGFAYSSPYRPRPAYHRTREVSVYVDAGLRGRGVARALYVELHARLRADGVHRALAVIALPNPASESLHRSLGYQVAGVLPEVGHKLGRWIDTAVWSLAVQ